MRTDFVKSKYLLIIIIIFGFLVRLYMVSEPWTGHHDWNGVGVSNIARNTIRYGGFFETNFAIIHDFYQVSPEDITYYNHHPPFPYYLLTMWFYVFGMSEWTTRILFILFSVAAIFSVYLMTKRIWNEKIALYAAFFVAFMPGSIYFGRMVNPEPMILFFVTAGIYFYFVWLDTQKMRHYFIMLAFLVLAQLSDWPGYPLSMVPVLHNLFFGGEKRNVRLMVAVILVGLLNFLIFLGFAFQFPGTFDDFSSQLGSRTVPYFLTFHYWLRHVLRVFAQFTFVVVGLAGYAGYLFWKRRKKIDSKAGFIIVYSLMALVVPLVESQGSYTHDYMLTYNLIPMFAILGAIGLTNIVSQRNRILILVLFAVLSFVATLFYFNIDTNYDRYHLGKLISEHTNASEAVMISSGFIGPHVSFYADRHVVWGVNTPDNLSDRLMDVADYRYWIYKKGTESELLSVMESRHESIEFLNYIFFDLRTNASSIGDGGHVAGEEKMSDVAGRQYVMSDRKRQLKERYKCFYELFMFW